MDYNPLDDPVPDDYLQRVHAFAKDLAYGASQGLWAPEFLVGDSSSSKVWISTTDQMALINKKWSRHFPFSSLLVSFGYLQVVDQVSESNVYLLTPKAFSLLQQPVPTSIFISYRRSQSSTLAMLILCRFKAELALEPFLDLNINPGEDWQEHLRNKVSGSEYFICLVGPATLESEVVRREITWALQTRTQIIPVWHGGFSNDTLNGCREAYPELETFYTKNAILVEQENPVAYEGAIVQLLNRFGVTP